MPDHGMKWFMECSMRAEVNHPIKTLLVYGMAMLVAAGCMVAMPPLAMAASYGDFARAITSSLPEGARFRPDLEEALVRMVNGYRSSKGRARLAADKTFQLAARAQAADMMLNNFMGHRASTGHDLKSRTEAFAGDSLIFPAIGENAARDLRNTPAGEAKARALLDMWVNSSGHRKNLTSRNFTLVSTGVIERDGKLWAVQIYFAAPRESKGLFQ